MTVTYADLRRAAEDAWRPIEDPERPLIKVGLTTDSIVVGAHETLAAIETEIESQGLTADVMITGAWGASYAEPVVEIRKPGQPGILYRNVSADKVPDLLDQVLGSSDGVPLGYAFAALSEAPMGQVPALTAIEFFAGQTRRLMSNAGITSPEEIDHYIAHGGYEGLSRALEMDQESVISQVLDSGLWGRGGAAFPTGRKWDFLRTSERTPKYLICNADEGDPGSFVNRHLMESDPHLIVEGMAIGGFATGGSYGYVYIRDEYPLPVARMERAVEQAREKGLLGEDILGSGFSFDLEVVRGAGSYVCGEETGLIASLEDRRGMPKIRPPFPAQAGVFAQPSNVNNVESYANVPMIMRHGAAWYSSVGSENHKGTKMFSLSGQIQRVGILEVPLGTPMSSVVMEMGGGPPEGRRLKAIQPGGPLSGIVHGDDIGIALEPEPFRERGMFMGSGGLVILDDTNCVVDLCTYFEWFAEDESCGRCTTCFAGTRRLLEILRRIGSGRGRPADLDLINLLGETMRHANCVHGQAAPTCVQSMFRFFEDELMEHLERKRCPAKACRGLIRYEVLHQSDRLPVAAAVCPTDAFIEEDGGYRIDQEKCIKCDACREQVPYAITVSDEFGI